MKNAVRPVLRPRALAAIAVLIVLSGCSASSAHVSGPAPRAGTASSGRTPATTAPEHTAGSLGRTLRHAVTTTTIATTTTTTTTTPPSSTTSTTHAHVTTTTTTIPASAGGVDIPGTRCPAFPADNVWNTPITGLPVDPNSSRWVKSMDASNTLLHPDYGPSGNAPQPYGIPWQVVSPSQPLLHVAFTYASESDPGPYPLSASTPIEGGSDRHAIMVNPSTCTLYELWDTQYQPDGRSTAGSGAIWDLESNALRPAGWTSADAAGLPILPGLVNYNEVASGSMDHAIRFTAECTQQAYIWPARHQAGQSDDDCPPMGTRFRLSASFNLPESECSATCQTVIVTMKTYGLILADNGSNWYFQGTADTRWTYTEVDQLKQIPASQFVAVDESCLMVNASSGQAYQPGTAGYRTACG